MKKIYILGLLLLIPSLKTFAFSNEALIYGATNNYPDSTLYIKNTDPNPGTVNNADGNSIISVRTGDQSPNFAVNPNRYVVPYDRFGGKIYVWLVANNTKKVINAAMLWDKETHLYFSQDAALVPISEGAVESNSPNTREDHISNVPIIKIAGKPDVFDWDKSKMRGCRHPNMFIEVDKEGKISFRTPCGIYN